MPRSTAAAVYNIRHPKKRAFLAAYGAIGTIRAACQSAGIDRKTFYNWQEQDLAFAAAAQIAKEEFGDRLEEKLAQLALRQDNVTSLIVALKMAGRFTERTQNEHTHSGPDGNPIQVSVQALVADIHTSAERVLAERSGAFSAPALGSGDLESSESEDATG